MRVVHDDKGRPQYMIWTSSNELFGDIIVHSSLPEELLWMVGRDILALLSESGTSQDSEVVINLLSARLNSFPLTRYFQIPDIALNGDNIQRFTYERFKDLLNYMPEPYDHVYSDYYNPLWFEAMKYQFYKLQFLDIKTFERETVRITRKEFQMTFCDQRAASQYVRFYSKYNVFYSAREAGYNIFLMTTGLQLDMVLILKDNEEN